MNIETRMSIKRFAAALVGAVVLSTGVAATSFAKSKPGGKGGAPGGAGGGEHATCCKAPGGSGNGTSGGSGGSID